MAACCSRSLGTLPALHSLLEEMANWRSNCRCCPCLPCHARCPVHCRDSHVSDIKLLVVQADDLQGFHCVQPMVQHRYKYKHLRATIANLPQPRDATAQTATKASTQ